MPFWLSTDLPMPPCSRTQTSLQSCAIWQIYSANWMKMSLQGKDTSILNLYDKVGGFLKKAELWRRSCAQEDFNCFPQLDDFHSHGGDICTTGLGEKPISLVWSKAKQAPCHLSGKALESVIRSWPQDEVWHVHTYTVCVWSRSALT